MCSLKVKNGKPLVSQADSGKSISDVGDDDDNDNASGNENQIPYVKVSDSIS